MKCSKVCSFYRMGLINHKTTPLPNHFLDGINSVIQENNQKSKKIFKNRVLITVLRELLLKQLDNGTYEPRKLKREKVKEVLLSFRRNLQ